MSLIGMAVYSTEENKKDECLEKTLESLYETVDFSKHRLMLSVNARTEKTDKIISWYSDELFGYDNGGIISDVIYNHEGNIGTAEAINKVWKFRKPGENAIKMDDDVVIYNDGWVDLMDEAISRDATIGIIGLKRKDLIQTTWHDDPHYKSTLKMLSHKPGEKWINVEQTGDVIGTCTMYSSALLDKIGYLFQVDKYGYDDNLACHRSHLAGFYNCFLNHIEIDHIDPGGTSYQQWKEKHSGECTAAFQQMVYDMIAGRKDIYYNPFI